MQKLLTGLAALTALAFAASSAQAACPGHDVTASSQRVQEDVAMSTYDGAAIPAPAEDAEKAAEATTESNCAEGEANCTDGTK